MRKIINFLALGAVVFAAEIGYSIAPQQEILRSLAPELSAVALVPAGADPHTYELRAQQAVALENAKVFLALGVESEDLWLPKIAKKFAIVRTDEQIAKRQYTAVHEHGDHHHAKHEHDHDHHDHHRDHHHGEHAHDHHHADHHAADHDHHHADHAAHDHADHHAHDHHADHHGDHEHHHAEHAAHHHHHSGTDVHVWTSVSNLAAIARASSAAIAEHFPELASAQPERLGAFLAKLERTDARIRELLAPLKVRGFVDAHPSWGYFADEYGLSEHSLEFEGKEAKAATLARLKELAAAKQVCVIVSAPQFSDKLAQVLARETKLAVVSIDALSQDFLAELEKFAVALNKYCK